MTDFEAIQSKNDHLLSGLIRIHVLYHASQAPIFGFGIIEELQRHGYKMSPGALYPMLHGLEKNGLLRSEKTQPGKNARRVYRTTPAGQIALENAREKVKILLGELLE